MLLSIVIPFRNEEDSLRPLMVELDRVHSKSPHPLEIILVNDASTDGTGAILDEFSKKYSYVRAFHLAKHGGQSGCYELAFRMARGEFVIRIDGDLQNDPDDLFKVFPLLERGCDMVMGVREAAQDRTLVSYVGAHLYDWLIRLVFDSPLSTHSSNLIAFRAEFLRDLHLSGNDHRYIPLFVLRRGAERVGQVPIANRIRKFGNSKYNRNIKYLLGLGELLKTLWRIRRGHYDFPEVSALKRGSNVRHRRILLLGPTDEAVSLSHGKDDKLHEAPGPRRRRIV